MPDLGNDEALAFEEGEPAAPLTSDEILLAARDVAYEALLEITPRSSIGEPAGSRSEGEHLVSLYFECKLPGYPGWHWTVSLSRVDEASAPNVLEAELLPGETALLAPDWIPWSDRLADYRAAQKAAAERGEESDEGEIDEELDVDDFDDDVLDEVLDELDEDFDDEDEPDDDDSEESDEEDSDDDGDFEDDDPDDDELEPPRGRKRR